MLAESFNWTILGLAIFVALAAIVMLWRPLRKKKRQGDLHDDQWDLGASNNEPIETTARRAEGQ